MEPKFRAWLTEDKLMSPVTSITFFRGCMDVTMPPNKKVTKVNQVIKLMQSTGLKDKNGKEIFEGDIVKYKAGCNTFTEEVAYNKNFAGFGVVDADANIMFTFGELAAFIGLNSIEVIGNIYDNPELLEEEITHSGKER